MKSLLKSLPLAILVLVYMYAATSKLADLPAFHRQLWNQAFSHAIARFLMIGLPLTEYLLVVLLFPPATRRAGLILSFLLLLIFTTYVVLILLHFWPRVPCACGGVLSSLGWRPHLLFNLALLLINFLAWQVEKPFRSASASSSLI